MRQARVAAIGECMLELSVPPAGLSAGDLRMGFGGDTLNTAIYLARLGVAVDYVSALGEDNFSAWMLERWREEGVGTGLVAQLPDRLPGLYAIETGDAGERRFSYWRREAPARELFDEPRRVAGLVEQLEAFDLVYLSGITLSLYTETGRERLFEMLGSLRGSGVKVGFDGNYRPAGWPQAATARETFQRACSVADIVLPTFEDEQQLFGDASPQDSLARIAACGANEIVLKQGPRGCLVARGDRVTDVPAEAVQRPVDTTAAGDSFNAGYLAGRLCGKTPEAAARQGHRLAAQVIQCRGAILPRDQMPDPEN